MVGNHYLKDILSVFLELFMQMLLDFMHLKQLNHIYINEYNKLYILLFNKLILKFIIFIYLIKGKLIIVLFFEFLFLV